MLNMFKSILKWFVFIQSNHCNHLAWWEGTKLYSTSHCTVAVVHFTDQNWVPKTVCCIKRVMVCKIGFTNWNAKILLTRASMVVTYYIKLFWTGTNRHNGILMSLLLLVAETKRDMFGVQFILIGNSLELYEVKILKWAQNKNVAWQKLPNFYF